jgi:hypothetical protein
MTVVVDQDHDEIVIRRETLDEMSDRFHSWIKPGTPPLLDVHGFYDQRPPRL